MLDHFSYLIASSRKQLFKELFSILLLGPPIMVEGAC